MFYLFILKSAIQGDRVILGGDHYFRFNHPAEVQSGKRVSCWTGAGDGQKDFEFAKNELLAAQRAKWVLKNSLLIWQTNK